jgi:hypothetical protein
MEDSMNVLTLLGAAVSCREFCDLLFKDPAEAAQLLGFTLSRSEFEQLQELFNKSNHKKICDQIGQLREMICKKSPCPFAPYLSDRQDACMPAAS